MKPWLWMLAVLMFAPRTQAAEPPNAEQVRQVMGTMATVQAWSFDTTMAARAVEAAYAAFDHIDSLMSTWRDDSVLSSLNRAEKGQWVDIGPELCRVLDEAKSVSTLSEGAFDPTVLPLVKLWGFRGGSPAVPDSASLALTLGAVDHHLLELDLETSRARLLSDGMAVDLGGIAKGYALDCAAEAMRRSGAIGGVIDLGGNILAFGQGPNRRVGIVDPNDPHILLAAIPLADASVATSGQYEKFLTIEGRRFGHILDARTGWPVAQGVSVTVVAPKGIQADALATAAVVLGKKSGLSLLEMISGVEAVMAIPDGLGGFLLKTTSGFVSLPGAP